MILNNWIFTNRDCCGFMRQSFYIVLFLLRMVWYNTKIVNIAERAMYEDKERYYKETGKDRLRYASYKGVWKQQKQRKVEAQMVKILSDSTSDLSKELIEKYKIGIIPLYVVLGENEYKDGINIKPEDLYKWSDEHGQTPKTAAPSVADIEEFLDKDSKDEYIIFTISSSMSASNNNARLAAEDLGMEDRVFVIDSENLSTGIGLQIIRAAELAAEGKDAKEIVEYLDELKKRVRASFIIDTLVYLYRGGRCSGLAAFFGSALKLHPRISVTEGAMHPEKKYRGKGEKYVMEYVKDMEAELLGAENARVFITHSGCDREVVNAVKDYLESLEHFDEIIETRAGAVISSHCGPGTLGVLFISK